MTPLKRSRSEESDMAVNGLMLLSKLGEVTESKTNSSAGNRVFTCKTCNREFPSFQALGGHRASHKKLPKLSSTSSASSTSEEGSLAAPTSPPKPKTHECSICGLEFAIGQALGGHMRRHRQQIADAAAINNVGDHDDHRDERSVMVPAVPVLKKSNSSKRVCLDFELDLDLHLGPPGSYRNDRLTLQLMSPLC